MASIKNTIEYKQELQALEAKKKYVKKELKLLNFNNPDFKHYLNKNAILSFLIRSLKESNI
jgi:hypothetical protein